MLTDPPEPADEEPPAIDNLPPSLLSPAPTVMLIDPALAPPAAAPLLIPIAPDRPALLNPDEIDT
jgi:hypothetical protein